ncbi:MAG: hypothetical protein APF80_17640 [Alphaproteobacteria bacterium BRH_c36]|nr:MAG: hypothetical protein APF80_17640 [Alphaproteobacteria bacterium BRH_c36]
MPTVKLTDLVVQRLRRPERGNVTYWDSSLPSFGVRVGYGGTKSFIIMVKGRRKALGRYPMVPLSQAREEAKRILYDRLGYAREQTGLDVSYPEAVERYLRAKEGEIAERTWAEYARYLRGFNFPGLVSEVRAYEIDDALERISGQSNRSHAYTVLKIFFNWCLAREYCEANPLQKIKKPRIPSSRERVLAEEELVAIWNACENLGKYGAIVRILMLTGQRRGQIDRLQEAWVDEQGINFPARVMKNGRDHYCPIGRLTKFVLLQVQPVGGYYFSPIGLVGHPFSAWSKNKGRLDSMVQLDPWTLHDLRRTWSTNASALDIPPHITERILSHASPEGRIAKIYNRYLYREEMAAAMDKMNSHILSLISQEPT